MSSLVFLESQVYSVEFCDDYYIRLMFFYLFVNLPNYFVDLLSLHIVMPRRTHTGGLITSTFLRGRKRVIHEPSASNWLGEFLLQVALSQETHPHTCVPFMHIF